MGAPYVYPDDDNLSECCGASTVELGDFVVCLECGDQELSDSFWRRAEERRQQEEADYA